MLNVPPFKFPSPAIDFGLQILKLNSIKAKLCNEKLSEWPKQYGFNPKQQHLTTYNISTSLGWQTEFGEQ